MHRSFWRKGGSERYIISWPGRRRETFLLGLLEGFSGLTFGLPVLILVVSKNPAQYLSKACLVGFGFGEEQVEEEGL